jgi:transcriptional regulator with XRE-family HTH domain
MKVQKADMAGAVGYVIYTRRQLLGITQRDLAARLGITQTQVWQYEKGAVEPGLARFMAIARALDVTPGQMLDLAQHELLYRSSEGVAPV